MESRLTVIIPFYNENEHNIHHILRRIIPYDFKWLIIDDGSKTPCLLNHTIRKNTNEGYGAAIKTGVENCDTEYVAIIDSDNQYNSNDIIRLWKSLNNEDMLIGKRERHQGDFNRLWGRLLLKLVASLLSLRYIPDLNSGIRIFRRELALAYAPILCNRFSYTSTITLSMILDGYKVEWMPCEFNERQGNKSSMKAVKSGLVTVYHLLRIAIGLRTRRIRKWMRRK